MTACSKARRLALTARCELYIVHDGWLFGHAKGGVIPRGSSSNSSSCVTVHIQVALLIKY